MINVPFLDLPRTVLFVRYHGKPAGLPAAHGFRQDSPIILYKRPEQYKCKLLEALMPRHAFFPKA
jgi:hypothetical protein